MSTDHPDIAVYPPVAFAIAVIVSAALGVYAPLGILPDPWIAGRVLGILLLAAASVLGSAAAGLFLRLGTPISPHKSPKILATGGIYRITRNPMYVALVAALSALGLIFSNTWAIVAAVALWAVLHWGVVLPEERFLRRKFGAEYDAFLASARRWL